VGGGQRAGERILTCLSVLKQTAESPFLGERLRQKFSSKNKFWPVSHTDLDLNPGFESGFDSGFESGFESGSETYSQPDPDPEPDPKHLFGIRNTV